jgi:zinc transport system permease protein
MLDLIYNPPLFLILAIIGGLLVATISAPLGVFMVWQRQSYFGATLAHSALLGVSLGLLLDINPTIGVVFISMIIGVSLYILEQKSLLSADTLLGILAHSSLAFGLVILNLQPNIQVDLMSYLFGDILSIDQFDILLLLTLLLLVFVFFINYWNQLLNLTLNKELAETDGINTKSVQLGYILLLALLISLSIKIVGMLLITSLLIIPAAAAHKLAKTPERMLVYSFIIGILSVISGLILSITLDTPTGPSIVISASIIFLLILLKPSIKV